MVFLSTLSLRRATVGQKRFRQKFAISIHALLAESDAMQIVIIVVDTLFLSTLSLRRATALGLPGWLRTLISIHALLAESDAGDYAVRIGQIHFYPRSPCGERRLAGPSGPAFLYNFYPRSPCGERRPQSATSSNGKAYFYPRSPCGERLTNVVSSAGTMGFLSTLSLRRATIVFTGILAHNGNFYPRSPCGERQWTP